MHSEKNKCQVQSNKNGLPELCEVHNMSFSLPFKLGSPKFHGRIHSMGRIIFLKGRVQLKPFIAP